MWNLIVYGVPDVIVSPATGAVSVIVGPVEPPPPVLTLTVIESVAR